MDPAIIDRLAESLTAQAHFDGIDKREEIRTWRLSGVERLRLYDETGVDTTTLIFKYAQAPFTREAAHLLWLRQHGVPVPELHASDHQDGFMGMLIEDLGQPIREATIDEAAQAAVVTHRSPPPKGVVVLDTDRLAQLPARSLGRVSELHDAGRWRDVHDITRGLQALERVARRRADGAELAPWGLCHSEFHPTSIHVGADGWRLLDWARAFTGPGLLDLASWQNTTEAPDFAAFDALLTAYVAAGGHPQATWDRGGLPAARWAYGWHRLWVIDWYLEQCTVWIADPEQDPTYQRTIRRHLAEAIECLEPTT